MSKITLTPKSNLKSKLIELNGQISLQLSLNEQLNLSLAIHVYSPEKSKRFWRKKKVKKFTVSFISQITKVKA